MTKKHPHIKRENIITLCEKKFLKFFQMDYDNGSHYLVASRRTADNLVALKSEEELKSMMPDAVTCVLSIQFPGQEPKLYLEREFRYPAGAFLLSPPAGLIDPEDMEGVSKEECLIKTAKREIFEETGVVCEEKDIEIIGDFFFSTPGMTDESNALVFAKAYPKDAAGFSDDGAVGLECFDGYRLFSKDEARRLLKSCKDEQGIPFSVYTWCALMYFLSR